ncbi:hypothetical protein DBR43_03480 [Pedobacter sp. KBW06]|uniref:TlpA disulfide reductase family protein n=1 Tax=Pedobacter sp. KBW06 TaxID=2153359 RepID=UPI000F59F07F|nr:TlpA disulfide reductase family protein [Pedobacter sp. KBW06]RQO74467.1 hypothetical protein DBR43_03480 [Pedobacter sp. KBW06]
MRTKTLLTIFLLPVALTAQVKSNKGFTLRGHLTNAANKLVYLTDLTRTSGKVKYQDSTLADAQGRFLFKGVVSEPSLFNLQFKNGRGSLDLYIENTDILLEGNADSLMNTKSTGSKEDMIRQEFQKLMFSSARQKPVEEDRSAYKAVVTSGDDAAIKLEREKFEARSKNDLMKNIETIVKKYPNSAIAVYLVGTLATFQETQVADRLLKLVEDTPMGQQTKTKALRQNINLTLSLRVGTKAPDFEQPDTSGRQISLSSMKGKYVLLDFWASWCTPCRAENPHLLQAYAKFKDKGFTIFSVSTDTNRSSWLKAVRQDNLQWSQASDLKAPNKACRLYGVSGIPANFLIDRDGKIIATNLIGSKLEEVLEKLL